MTSTTADLDGIRGRITVRTWANDDPRYLVLLAHGLGEHSARYEHVASHLLADGAEVVGPDHWGHGLSDGSPGLVDDLEGVVDDLTSVADAAQVRRPGLPLVVLGHSIGGNDLMLSLLDLDEIPDIPIDPAFLSRDPDVGRAYAEDPLVYHGALHRETIASVKDAVATIVEGGSLGDLPTLWIHGELDPLAPIAETTRAFDVIGGPALEQKVYPGAMHEIFNETNQDEVLDDVTTFIGKTLAG